MKKIILSLIMICGIVSVQAGNFLDFLPLKVGNVWVYKWKLNVTMPPVNDSGYFFVKAADVVIRNNRNYFSFYTTPVVCSGGFGNIFTNNLIRIDSVSGNVMKFDSLNYCTYSPFEKLIDSLKMRIGDSINYNCQTGYYRPFCNDTLWQNIFGQLRPSKTIKLNFLEAWELKRFVKGIGISSFGHYGTASPYNFYSCSYILNGCVINGIVYGDTSLTSVNKISSEVPESFSLSQNYPNPFNPVTKIRFDIPLYKGGQGDVTLKIYDVLGREVTTLVNEQLSPGTYEVEFDGTNYPSGVYYYTLPAGYFSQTKKMVLIK